MKKKLLSLLLVLALVIGVTVITTMAEEATPATHSNHCVCGGHAKGVGDHTACTTIENWQPLTVDCFQVYTHTNEKNYLSLPSGNYYLPAGMEKDQFDLKTAYTALGGNDVFASAIPIIAPDAEVTICTNGYRLYSNAGRAFNVNGKLNITDCSEKQSGRFNGAGAEQGVWYGYAGADVNLYAGTVSNSRAGGANNTGIAAHNTTSLHVAAETAPSKFTMYGGTITGEKITVDKDGDGGHAGALLFNTGSEFTMYGGTITGSEVATNSGTILLLNTGKIQLLGGIIKAGKAGIHSDCISANNIEELVIGGDVQIDDINIRGTTTFTTQELTGSVGLSTTSGNMAVLGTVAAGEEDCFVSNMPTNHELTFEDGNIAFAAAHTDHCVCGGNLTGVAAKNHTCAETAPTWTALTQDNISTYLIASETHEDGKGTEGYYRFASSGYYYLAGDVSVDQPLEIHQGDQISLCLNGFELASTTTVNSALRVWGELNISDCTGDGVISSHKDNKKASPVLYMRGTLGDAESGVVVNLYGGTLKAQDTNKSGAGVMTVGDDQDGILCTFNMFGGTITGGYGTQGNVLLSCKGTDAQLADYAIMNMYGGSITNGQSSGNAGNIQITRGKLYMYGGSITGGVSKYGDVDIAIGYSKGNTAVLDGDVTIGSLCGYGKSGNAYTIGENFSTEAPIALYAYNSAGQIVTGAKWEHLQWFTSLEPDTYQVTMESATNGIIYLRAADDHYACLCGKYDPSGVHGTGTACYMRKWTPLTGADIMGTDSVDAETGETVHTDGIFGATQQGHASLAKAAYKMTKGTYYLTEDVTLDAVLWIPSGQTVNIDLNGHTLTSAATTERTFYVQGTLNICDSSYDATKENKSEQFGGWITGQKNAAANAIYVGSSGKAYLFGGNYTNGSAKTTNNGFIANSGNLYIYDGYFLGKDVKEFGAVLLNYDGGKLHIYGGELVGAKADAGGVIYIQSKKAQTVNIYGGTLIGGECANGGAIWMHAVAGDGEVITSTLNISGGTIIGGSSSGMGGAIYAEAGTINITGGEIKDGYAGQQGGNIALDVFADSDSGLYAVPTLNISGGTISGGHTETEVANNGYGGNIYVHHASVTVAQTDADGNVIGTQKQTVAGSLYITGGTITKGVARSAGNIWSRGYVFISDGLISDGTAIGGNAGNLRINSVKGQLEMIGGTITGGNATGNGGNISFVNAPLPSTIKNAAITNGTAANGGNIETDSNLTELTLEGCTISGGQAAGEGGNLDISAVKFTMENCTVTDGISGNDGGNLYLAGNEVVLTDCIITGGKAARRAGNVNVFGTNATFNNCTVTGGIVTGKRDEEGNLTQQIADLYGYNVSVNNNADADITVTFNGGTFSGAGAENLAPSGVQILSSGLNIDTVVTGAPVMDHLRMGTYRKLTVGELTEGADIKVSSAEIAVLFAPDAEAYAQYFSGAIAGINVVATEEGLALVAENPYWAFNAADNAIAGYKTLAEAAAAEGCAYVRLVQDHVTDEVITGDAYLDLSGHDLSGLTVNGNLYVIDRATNNYKEDVWGSLTYTVGENGSINGGKTVYAASADGNFVVSATYVMLPNADGSVSFHRVTLNLTHISLKPAADALGFKATVYGDSAVQAAITGYGFNMGVEGGNLIAYTKNEALTEGVFTLRLQNILKNNGGEMTIVGEPVIFFGEESVSGGTHTTTMKSAIETIEATLAENAEAYTQTQIEAVQALIAQYESKMSGWNIDTIKAWVPSTEEETPAA